MRFNVWRWKHIEDIDNPGDVYLSRLMLVWTPWFGLYLHIIRRPDWAQCQHDHPWAFVTFILKGGYEEEVGPDKTLHVRKRWYLGYRPRAFEHRITRLLHGNAVTLVLRFKNHDEWGFRMKDGTRLSWMQYLGASLKQRILWCDER